MANPRRVLDIIGKYESGPSGYQAVNQIGVAGGRGVLGYSGDIRKMKQHGGRALTDMTVGEIMNLQKDTGISNTEWINKGKLHAVGRYQFIGPTLRERVSKLKIDPSQKFTPELQDKLALDYIKEAKSISPWIGPSDKATAAERADINAFLKNPNQPIAPNQQSESLPSNIYKEFKPDVTQQTVPTQKTQTQLPGQPININLIVPEVAAQKEPEYGPGSQFLKYYIGKGLETPQMSTGLKINPIDLLTKAASAPTNYFNNPTYFS